ncbi:Neuropeptide SIFamide receptor [Taenia solium]|eukprot:TsM_000210900 transcript=TsM_000210900 gene=TsM_000210900
MIFGVPRKNESHQVRLHPVGGINRVKTVKIIKMLAIVVINFCICWLPLFTIFNIIKFSPTYLAVDFNTSTKATDEESSMLVESNDDNLMRVIFLVVPFAQLLGSANSCVNPWIYCFYSKRYRRGFKRVFLCRSMKAVSVRRPPRTQPTTSHFHRDHNLALRSVEQTALA